MFNRLFTIVGSGHTHQIINSASGKYCCYLVCFQFKKDKSGSKVQESGSKQIPLLKNCQQTF